MAETTEKWIKGVAITTTLLAVCTAISSLKASSYSTRVQIHTTMMANSWAHFQAKSIKEHSYRLQQEDFQFNKLLAAGNPEAESYAEDRIKHCKAEIDRYQNEKGEIQDDVDKLQKQEELFKQHNASFALAVMLLQIAILMSSVSALMKWKMVWFGGMVFGVIGLVYMVNGFFLWF